MPFARLSYLFCLALFLAPQFGSAGERVQYELRGLKPISSNKYEAADRDATRVYFRFENADGMHTVIYENLPGTPAVPAARELLSLMAKPGLLCSLSLECRSPAFCLGACKNRYYEVSNTPDDLIMVGRNQCTISSHHCEAGSVAAARGAKP